jgi:hypothetical protein
MLKNVKYFEAYYPVWDYKTHDWKRVKFWLEENAADDCYQMRLDFYTTYGAPFLMTDGGRTHAQQKDVYVRKPGFAAKPGNSWHEAGMAIDIDVTRNCQAIMKKRGYVSMDKAKQELRDFTARYGFVKTVRKEEWHRDRRAICKQKSLKAAIAYIGNNS